MSAHESARPHRESGSIAGNEPTINFHQSKEDKQVDRIDKAEGETRMSGESESQRSYVMVRHSSSSTTFAEGSIARPCRPPLRQLAGKILFLVRPKLLVFPFVARG